MTPSFDVNLVVTAFQHLEQTVWANQLTFLAKNHSGAYIMHGVAAARSACHFASTMPHQALAIVLHC